MMLGASKHLWRSGCGCVTSHNKCRHKTWYMFTKIFLNYTHASRPWQRRTHHCCYFSSDNLRILWQVSDWYYHHIMSHLATWWTEVVGLLQTSYFHFYTCDYLQFFVCEVLSELFGDSLQILERDLSCLVVIKQAESFEDLLFGILLSLNPGKMTCWHNRNSHLDISDGLSYSEIIHLIQIARSATGKTHFKSHRLITKLWKQEVWI